MEDTFVSKMIHVFVFWIFPLWLFGSIFLIILNVIRTGEHGNIWLASLTKKREAITFEYVWRKTKEKYYSSRTNHRKWRNYIAGLLAQQGITRTTVIDFLQMIRRTYFFYFLELLLVLLVYWIFN